MNIIIIYSASIRNLLGFLEMSNVNIKLIGLSTCRTMSYSINDYYAIIQNAGPTYKSTSNTLYFVMTQIIAFIKPLFIHYITLNKKTNKQQIAWCI